MKRDNINCRLSVCMASYNGDRFIAKQIFSILQQLGDSDEMIISDDHSTDDTVNIIKSYADPRIKFFPNIGLKGPKGNFQNALSHANGEYIFLSDQDDVWLPGKVDKVVELLNMYDLVLTDCIVVDKDDKVIHPSFFRLRNSHPGLLYNLYKNSYVGCCMAFRVNILSYALPIPEAIHMHDWWIGLLAEVHGRVYFCPEPLIHYVRHDNNASPTGEKGYNYTKRLVNRLMLAWNLSIRLFFWDKNTWSKTLRRR